MTKNRFGFVPVVVLVIILGAAILAGAAYFGARNYSRPSPTPIVVSPVVSPTSTVNNSKNTDTASWKTYTWGKYEFSYPSNWKPIAAERGVAFTIDEKNAAFLRCPIREIGYEAWDVESQVREIKLAGESYPIELWSLKDKDRNTASDFSLILINRVDFSQSCEISIAAGKNYDPKIAQKIYSSISVKNTQGDKTENWKTYRSEKYGFEFKYPLSWQKEPGRDDLASVKFQDIEFRGDVGIVHAFVFVEIEEKSLDVASEWRKTLETLPGNKIIIAGTPAIVVQNGEETAYLIFSGSTMYKIVTKGTSSLNQEILDHILSTFKFL